MKLTNNFYLYEFTQSRFGSVDPGPQQIWCIKKLCENILQPIRDKFVPKDGQLKINSGIRNATIVKGLVNAGYGASKTSDHLCWSKENPIGTGAADFTILPYSDELMMKVVEYCKSNLDDKINQLIFYPDMNFIHVSNAWNVLFNSPQFTSPEKYLIFKNNTYSRM